MVCQGVVMMSRPHATDMGDGPRVVWVTANTGKKKSGAAEKGWSYSSDDVRTLIATSQQTTMLRTVT